MASRRRGRPSHKETTPKNTDDDIGTFHAMAMQDQTTIAVWMMGQMDRQSKETPRDEDQR